MISKAAQLDKRFIKSSKSYNYESNSFNLMKNVIV
jgi:hypothetical protein